MIKGNCYGQVLLLQKAMKDIEWWKQKFSSSSEKFFFSKMYTNSKWGMPQVKAGGSIFKNHLHQGNHINEKELLGTVH